MQKFADKITKLVKSHKLEEKDFKRGSISLFYSYIPLKKYEFNKTLTNIVVSDADWYSKTSKKIDEIESVANAGLTQTAKKCFEFYENNIKKYNSFKMVSKTIHTYGILTAISVELKKYRDENNILLISDTNVLIKEIIKDQDAPFILEKVGSQYKHILIDEFQDTSDYQWHNLLPIVKNALSENNQVLIVGDVKQSIYRWRGGNMKLLLRQVQQDLANFEGQTKVENLKNNYRTKGNIVKFNNAFFSLAKTMLSSLEDNKLDFLITSAYDSIEQIPQKEEGGSVKVQFFKKIKEEDSIIATKDQIVEQLVKDISKCQEAGFPFSKMLILARGNQEGVFIADYLNKEGIPFITQQSLLIKNTEVIQLLISILFYLNNEFDDLIKSRLLYQYCQNFDIQSEDLHLLFTDYRIDKIYREKNAPKKEDVSEDDPEMVSKVDSENTDAPNSKPETQKPETQKEKSIEKPINENNGETSDEELESLFKKIIPKSISENSHELSRKSLLEVVEELIFILKLNKEPNIYVQRFQDVCIEQSQKGTTNIADFLEYWTENKDKISILSAEGKDAIQIMTIHKSKGLESEIVFLPFANYSFVTKSETKLWVDDAKGEPFEQMGIVPVHYSKRLKESFFEDTYYEEFSENLVESLNLAYVAFTRCKDKLFVYADVPAATKTSDGNDLKTFNKIMQSIFTSNEFEYKKHWSSENLNLTIGDIKDANEGETSFEENSILQNYFNQPYQSKIQIRCEEENYSEILDDEKARKIQMGIKAHYVLERMGKIDNLDRLLSLLIREKQLDKEDREPIKSQINELYKNDIFKDWFEGSWKSIAENTIICNGEMYKPDLVLTDETNETAIVVDYKKQVQTEKHVQQIQRYGSILNNMKQYQNIQLYLVYVTDSEIVPVQNAFTLF